jgi:hypothetical protein
MNNRSGSILNQINSKRGLLFGLMIVTALLSFEMFNYSTTDYALSDLLGELQFAGIRWATILAIAFCGIDFAGIARLFTPEREENEPAEVWYLFAAWLLAATMNALLTWWGVSLAVLGHETLGNAIINRVTMLRIVPVFVAVMVWLIRVLIIGTFSLAGDRLFTQSEQRNRIQSPRLARGGEVVARPSFGSSRRPQQPSSDPGSRPIQRPEPTYHPVSMSARNGTDYDYDTRSRKF